MLSIWHEASGSLGPVLRGCREDNTITISDLILYIHFVLFELHPQMDHDWDSNCDSMDK